MTLAQRALVLVWMLGCSHCGTGNQAASGDDAATSVGDDAAIDSVSVDSASSDATIDAPPFAPADHRPWPQLSPFGHKVMATPRLVTIVAANDDLATSLAAFSDLLVASDWWKAVAPEYGVGAFTDSVHVTGPAITASADLATFVSYVQSTTAPAPDGSTLYLVYLPKGVAVTGGDFKSFHTMFPDRATCKGDVLAFVARETPASGETQLDQLTKVASHEIIEGATDPTQLGFRLAYPAGNPWKSSVWSSEQVNAVEDGDLCEGTRIREPSDPSGWLYQRIWSNRAAAAGGDPCVPTLREPYYAQSIPQDWYSGSAGETVSIPMTGWSVAPVPNWLLYARLQNQTTAFASLTYGSDISIASPLGSGTTAPCYVREASNNGVASTLNVKIPATAASGDWAVIAVHAFREDPSTCKVPPADDLFHTWLVGVYVP